MPSPSRLGRAAALAAAVVATAGVGVAHAQIPGVDPTSSTVVADDPRIQVATQAPDLARGTVSVTVQNNTAASVTCTGLGNGGNAMTVTESDLVARAVSYYAKYPAVTDPSMNIAITGSSGLPNFGLDLGSVTSALPGSVMGMLRPEFGEQSVMGRGYTAARLAGHAGTVASVTVPARSGVNLVVPLGDPSVTPRTDFTSAALLGCVFGGQQYVFAGYQGGHTPSVPLGSLGARDTGRFGS